MTQNYIKKFQKRGPSFFIPVLFLVWRFSVWLLLPYSRVLYQFKELAHAYEVLNDPEKREIYDQYGEDALKEGMGGGGPSHSPFDIFESFFGGGGFGGELFCDVFVSCWLFIFVYLSFSHILNSNIPL